MAKTVPKYVCAIWVKDAVAAKLPAPTATPGTAEMAETPEQTREPLASSSVAQSSLILASSVTVLAQ